MAQASTGIKFNATAINKTGGVFRQIASSLASVGKIAAGVFAGDMLKRGFDSIVSVSKELGALSDVAMQAGLATDEITKMSTAFGVLGLKTNTPEQIAMAMQRMAKTTGETGVAGFERVIGAISKMGTVEERASAAMATFGRTGLDFLPLIEAAAKNGTAALHDVIDTMPGVSQAAADAGDTMADSIRIMVDGLKRMWMEFVGEVAGWFDGNFEGGVRQASLNAVAYIDYFVRRTQRIVEAWANGIVGVWEALGGIWQNVVQSWGDYMLTYFKSLGNWLMDVVNACWDDILEKGIFGKANENFSRTMNTAVAKLWDGVDFTKFFAETDDLEIRLQQKLEKAAKGAAAVSSAAVSISANAAATETAEQIETAAKTAAKAEFMTADTYRAATMSIRADYGKGESKTVKAIDRVKSVAEKIQKAVESTAMVLNGIEVS